MKTLGIAAIVAGVMMAGTVQAQQPQTMKGHLVDVMCASKHASDKEFVMKHDKDCLLMDACVKSGYSLVTADGKMLKLDARGSQQALDLIKKSERKDNWNVTVNGTVAGDTITVASIQLQ